MFKNFQEVEKSILHSDDCKRMIEELENKFTQTIDCIEPDRKKQIDFLRQVWDSAIQQGRKDGIEWDKSIGGVVRRAAIDECIAALPESEKDMEHGAGVWNQYRALAVARLETLKKKV